jgi:hypothetical protein
LLTITTENSNILGNEIKQLTKVPDYYVHNLNPKNVINQHLNWNQFEKWSPIVLENVKLNLVCAVKIKTHTVNEKAKVIETLWVNEYLREDLPQDVHSVVNFSNINRYLGGRLHEGEVIVGYVTLVNF